MPELPLPPLSDRPPNVPDEVFDPISCPQTVVWIASTQNTTMIAAVNWTRMVTSPGKASKTTATVIISYANPPELQIQFQAASGCATGVTP